MMDLQNLIRLLAAHCVEQPMEQDIEIVMGALGQWAMKLL